MDSKVSSETPFTPLVFFLGTGFPFLYHVTTGMGKPDALQLIFTLLPVETYISWGGLTVKLGCDGSEIKKGKKGERERENYLFSGMLILPASKGSSRF